MLTNKQYLFKLLKKEEFRQKQEINLIASENWVSKDVLKACGNIIQNKYAEGYPKNRYYKGCENIDKIEILCNKLIQILFHAKFSNCQVHSGASANLAAYSAACKYWKCKPQDIVGIGLGISAGGHLTHFNKMTISGNLYNAYTYGLTKQGEINYDEMFDLLKEHKNEHIILSLGFSAYSDYINYDKIAKFITKNKIECIVVCDVSHIAGIMVAGLCKNPLEYNWGNSIAILTSTTHKTLRCARHALIATNNSDIAKCIDKAVFPYLQGGPLPNMIAGVAVGLAEIIDNKKKYTKYIINVLNNMQALIKGMQKTNKQLSFLLNGSNNHLCLVDLRKTNHTGETAENLLARYGIICNRNIILDDKASNPSGIRLGTAYMTSKGWKEKQFYKLGQKIGKILS